MNFVETMLTFFSITEITYELFFKHFLSRFFAVIFSELILAFTFTYGLEENSHSC